MVNPCQPTTIADVNKRQKISVGLSRVTSLHFVSDFWEVRLLDSRVTRVVSFHAVYSQTVPERQPVCAPFCLFLPSRHQSCRSEQVVIGALPRIRCFLLAVPRRRERVFGQAHSLPYLLRLPSSFQPILLRSVQPLSALRLSTVLVPVLLVT